MTLVIFLEDCKTKEWIATSDIVVASNNKEQFDSLSQQTVVTD